MSAREEEIVRQTFLSEAGFLIEDVEQFILELDNPMDRPDCLARIFRTLHSLKGSAASVSIHDISSFAHLAEDYLSQFRDDPSLVTQDTSNILLEVRDCLKARIDALMEDLNSSPDTWERSNVELRLAAATQHKASAKPSKMPAFGLFDEEPALVPTMPAAEAVVTAKLKTKPTIKVDAERVGDILNLVNQLVVLKGQISNMPQFKERQNKGLLTAFEKTLKELYENILSMRMMPLKSLFSKLQRAARDTSVKLAKPIQFQMIGEEVELDRSILDLIGDPLVHLVRNSVDHGIEKGEARSAAGKNEEGCITLRAVQHSNAVLIEVSDDGGGIDSDRIKKVAVKKGLITENESAAMTREQAYDLLFKPGFSTAATVTDISGRGVGLDVVKTTLEQVKGRVDVTSQLHRGTCFRLTIPTSTALTTGLVVMAAQERFIIPMDHVAEFLKIKSKNIQDYSDGRQVIVVRDEVLSIFKLARFISQDEDQERDEYTTILIHENGEKTGLIVDEILGLGQFVLKALPHYLADNDAMTGAAVMSDGKVAPVIDPIQITQYLGHAKAS